MVIKKMLLKNWFWIIILIVLGIKYGFAQGLQVVKKYELPVYIIETDEYAVEEVGNTYKINFKDLSPGSSIYNKITYQNKKTDSIETFKGFSKTIYVSYTDYQDVIEAFISLKEAEPLADNLNYEVEGENWSISTNKTIKDWGLYYYGQYVIYNGGTKLEYSISEDFVNLVASLPLEIWDQY